MSEVEIRLGRFFCASAWRNTNDGGVECFVFKMNEGEDEGAAPFRRVTVSKEECEAVKGDDTRAELLLNQKAAQACGMFA